jgi:hypothetical protein
MSRGFEKVRFHVGEKSEDELQSVGTRGLAKRRVTLPHKETVSFNNDEAAADATRPVIVRLKQIAGEIAASIHRHAGPGLVRAPATGCLRVMRYPALRGGPESALMRKLAADGALRSIEHTDLNALSLLPSPTSPGLELLDKDGTWRLTDAVPGKLIVHAGQELEERSRGRFTATRHRVRNPLGPEEGIDRLSMALFVS